MKKNSEQADLSALLKELPPFVARNHPRFKELTGYSGRTIANLDSLKQGPPKRIMLGNTVAYERESLITWLESRSKVISQEVTTCRQTDSPKTASSRRTSYEK